MTATPDFEGLKQALTALTAVQDRAKYNKATLYTPYAKQREFHNLGATKRQRLLRAGNQNGKTYAGAMEVSYHLTGRYPPWWKGRRYTRAIKAWVGCQTGLMVRDNAQKLLFGEAGVEAAIGTGAVPKDAIIDFTLARGVTNLYDTVQVRHSTGGTSIVRFKTYDQKRAKWQGETLDLIWFDEEPPEDIYSEGLTRTIATNGMVFLTFTPLLGLSRVVKKFLQNRTEDMSDTNMTILDAEHIPPEEREKIIAGWPAHEREARKNGVPMRGSGKVFLTPEESLQETRLTPLPYHWVYLWGIDFGGVSSDSHPFAAVLLGWDRDADVIHVVHSLRMTNARPLDHAEAIKPWGPIPVAWPHDGWARESNGVELKDQYKKYLPMLPGHATFTTGGYSTEAGIMEMQERMATGKWKVFDGNDIWMEEYRNYHREEGLIVKVDDDLLSASRVGMMARRFAKALPQYRDLLLPQDNSASMCKNVEFEL